MGCFRRLHARRQPCALGNPRVIQLSRLCNGKQAIGDAGAEGLIDDPEIKRHGNWIGLVGAGIEELAVHHDGYRDHARFAALGNLHQPKRARPFVNLFALEMLREFLGVKRGAKPEARESHDRQGGDDGGPTHAI